MYEEIVTEEGVTVIRYTNAENEIWWVPVDDGNRMYQAYLESIRPVVGETDAPTILLDGEMTP